MIRLVALVVLVAVIHARPEALFPAVLAAVVVAGLGRFQGHRDTGKGLFGLWFRRRVLGRAG